MPESRDKMSWARLVVGAAALLAWALAAQPAGAEVSHEFGTAITGSGATALSSPTDIAVDQSDHDLYVTDTGNHRVEKFNEAGEFILMFGKEVNETEVNAAAPASEQDVCSKQSGDTCKKGAAGSLPGQFEEPEFVAVDNSSGGAGDVYVADPESGFVQKFDSTGHLISTWGEAGQTGTFGAPEGIDVSPSGILYVYSPERGFFSEVAPDGRTQLARIYISGGTEGGALKVDPAGNLYAAGEGGAIDRWIPNPKPEEGITFTQRQQVGTSHPTSGFSFDPVAGDIYQDTEAQIDHYSPDCNPNEGECSPIDSFGAGHLFGSKGVAVDGGTGSVYVANSQSNEVSVFEDVRPKVITGPSSEASETSVVMTGRIEPTSVSGEITECKFEYGFDKRYGHTIPCSPTTPYAGAQDVTATVTGLQAGTTDHYRLFAASANTKKAGADRTFVTTQPPSVDALSSENLTATSADLKGAINPNGLATSYQVEYGGTTKYGQVIPVPAGSLEASNSDQTITVHLENLTPHVSYHYRLVATNADGSTATVDHTFSFYPPLCPNSNVRQQTEASFLPDCRAYELVSASDAGGTLLYPGGPNSGQATDPSRFSYTGLWSTIPGSGGSPIDSNGDLYVATRTDTGWNTRYVGLPAYQAAVDGGPPQGLPNSAPGPRANLPDWDLSGGVTPADLIQNNVLTNPGMGLFVDWNDGTQGGENPTPIASNAGYVFSANGSLLDQWPTNLASVPAGVSFAGVQPPGLKALDCPSVPESGVRSLCPGDVTASADLSHFVYASEWNAFTPEGKQTPPGSVYDNNTRTGTTEIASKQPDGKPIESEPGDRAGDPLQIPAVSSDGSSILIAAGGVGPCGQATCSTPPCGSFFGPAVRCPMQASHLYMRVDQAVTYDVSLGHDVHYVGMTPDGSKVYFTTDEALLPEDENTSTDLYMWSAEKAKQEEPALTLISKPNEGADNEDNCNATWTSQCDVVPYSDSSYCTLSSGVGGNCRSDNSIAAENGDIYFFSPSQLVGSLGIPNKENLYDFRNGKLQYVTTFTAGSFCYESAISYISDSACSDTPIVRMQVSPTDSHMAFVTNSPVTGYNNAGHLEMYTYEPSTKQIVCVSCIPSGAPPTGDVEASQDGLFMTDDGRAFFTTEDALVSGDTNHGEDVYEYVGGQPQLITTGTGDTRKPEGLVALQSAPGLVGVSANGTDVYFSTYDTLTPQDHNGLFIKFYDARAGGGFPSPPEAPPCEAAEECHGPQSPSPTAVVPESAAALSGGNVPSRSGHKKHRHRERHHRRARHHKRQSAQGAER